MPTKFAPPTQLMLDFIAKLPKEDNKNGKNRNRNALIKESRHWTLEGQMTIYRPQASNQLIHPSWHEAGRRRQMDQNSI